MRAFCLVLVFALLAGCSRSRVETILRADGTRETWGISGSKPAAESAAMNAARDECRGRDAEAAIVSVETIYQGRITGPLRKQVEAGGPMPPFTRTHQDFKSTVIFVCK